MPLKRNISAARLGAELYVRDRTRAGLASVNRGFSSTMSGMGRTAGITSQALAGAISGNAMFAAAAGAGAFLSFAASASRAFTEVELKWAEVTTLLPTATKQATDQMLGDVRNFAKQTGFQITDSINATYQAISAGIDPSNSTSFLRVAGQAARGGITDLTTSVDALTSAMNAYALSTEDATMLSDAMFTAIRLGKTTFAELAPVMGPVLPIASSLNTEFQEITAAVAALTAQGNPTSIAMTQIRSALVALSKDTEAKSIFESAVGMTYAEYQAQGGTLQEALSIVVEEAEKAGMSIPQAFGRIEGANAALALSSRKGADVFTEAMGDIDGATAEAAAKIENTMAVQQEQVRAQIDDLRLSIGSTITDLTGFALDALGLIDRAAIGMVGRVNAAVAALQAGEPVGRTISNWWEHPEQVLRLWNADASTLNVSDLLAKRDIEAAGFTQADINNLMRDLGRADQPSSADLALLAGGVGGVSLPPDAGEANRARVLMARRARSAELAAADPLAGTSGFNYDLTDPATAYANALLDRLINPEGAGGAGGGGGRSSAIEKNTRAIEVLTDALTEGEGIQVRLDANVDEGVILRADTVRGVARRAGQRAGMRLPQRVRSG